MTTETAQTTGVASEAPTVAPSGISAILANLRDYGLLLALVAIMIVFQFLTKGVLFYPVNLTNIVLQNSYIIIMAMGMLLVIVGGHIDLSVGSVSGFVGALAAMMMVQWDNQLGFFASTIPVAIVCLIVGGLIGAAQGYWIAYHGIPSFIVTLAGMLVFKGLSLAILSGQSVGPFPVEFQALSAGFIPDIIGPLTIIPATLNAGGKAVAGTGIVLHSTTMLIGLIGIVAYVFFGLRARATRESHGYAAESFGLFAVKTFVIAALTLFLIYSFANYKGLPNVLIVMSLLIALFVFVTKKTTIGRRVYAMGGNVKAAALSGIKTKRLTLIIFTNMGVLAALAGLVYAARLNSATPKAGQGFELDVIAAVFIGGASMAGGVGEVAGSVIGAFIMGVMNNGMSIMGINIDWQQVIKGLVLLGAVVFDVYNKNKG